MDTKLKNRHSLGIFLIIITIILAAASMIGMYPVIERNAENYSQKVGRSGSYERENAREFSTEIMNSCYALWQEYAQEQAGYILTPAQVFLPDITKEIANGNDTIVEDTGMDPEGDYYRALQEGINERGSAWKEHFRELRSQMSYRMTNEKGEKLMENTGALFDRQNGIISVKASFDNVGRLLVESIDTDVPEYRDMITQVLGDSLSRYYFYDPMEGNYYGQMDYGSNSIRFTGPKNVTYEFDFNYSAVIPERGEQGSWDQISSYYYDGSTVAIALIIMAVVGLLALFFPCFRSLNIGQEKIFRAPLEVVGTIGFFCAFFLFSTVPTEIVARTMNGTLAAELVYANFLPATAAFLVWLLNFLCWAVGFGLLYWGITCIRSVFVLGPIRYIKERTLCGRCCTWIWRKCVVFVGKMTEIDWRSQDSKQILKLVGLNFIVLTIISCFWFLGIPALLVYSALLFWWLKKYYCDIQKKYAILLETVSKIADGDLNVEIEEDLGIFEPVKEELSVIQDGFKNAVDKEVKSQRMKTELITNVSHDLKTPLTAIITYVNLLKQEGVTEEDREKYIDILEQKSMRLKVLIEDLFDISKATSKSMPLILVEVDLVNLIKQVRLELYDRIEASGIEFRWNLPEDKVALMLDSQKTYRIFENLLVNITKYAMPGTRAYVDMTVGDWVSVTFKNISANEITVSPQELMERFVRGDEARNTDGSGLGMAIAKSFTEVQGGEMAVEIEADLFRVTVKWRKG